MYYSFRREVQHLLRLTASMMRSSVPISPLVSLTNVLTGTESQSIMRNYEKLIFTEKRLRGVVGLSIPARAEERARKCSPIFMRMNYAAGAFVTLGGLLWRRWVSQ